MAKKQFKIGEYAVGGIIAVEVTAENIIVNALDWNSKKPVLAEMKLPKSMPDVLHNIDCYLWDLTTSYYAGKVMDWIKTQIKK